MSQYVKVSVTTHDDGTFIRTAIGLNANGGGGIVILDPKGEPLFLLNLFCFEDGADVDVIPIGRFPQLRALAWDYGTLVLDQCAPVGNLIAVDARAVQENHS